MDHLSFLTMTPNSAIEQMILKSNDYTYPLCPRPSTKTCTFLLRQLRVCSSICGTKSNETDLTSDKTFSVTMLPK
ncbi:hypothetical protein HZH66_001943 [Vespula vulgaris]|uniref:Uncharacterized protein n=1 Tax=Vespula vulgaris TaxID=7454 RepID=A0A834KII5_VESVU|nr:hypothetical protein HZH66_001943 [Vespula vulgaris]